MKLSPTFEAQISHQYFNPSFSDSENSRLFGACTKVHGHTYKFTFEIQMEHLTEINSVETQQLLEKLKIMIQSWDHQHLDSQHVDFKNLIPTTENLALVLKQKIQILDPEHKKIVRIEVQEGHHILTSLTL